LHLDCFIDNNITIIITSLSIRIIMTLPQLQESEDEKKDGAEKKDDSIVYADLDKSAMSEGKRPSVSVENEKSEYAEIAPQAKE